jgi:AcrR family transcriptional regulator
MFTKNKTISETALITRPVGRPRGRTAAGAEMRNRLFATAIQLFGERGYEETTLRQIADRAGVSAGLLYRYFPSKRAVVLHLYEQLSADHALRAASLPPGTWTERFLFALQTSLEVLGPHRQTLASLLSVLVGDRDQGIFSPASAPCRIQLQAVFEEAAVGARNAPGSHDEAAALGRILYLAHMAVLLWWMLDRSEGQRATEALRAILRRTLPMLALAVRLRRVRTLVRELDAAAAAGLFPETR